MTLLIYNTSNKQNPMRDNPNEQRPLSQVWEELPVRPIQGKQAQYKINHKKFLGRGGFGIVYGGLRKTVHRTQQDTFSFEQVAIKEFKGSQRWRKEQDQDKQVIILKRYGSIMNKEYVLKVIEIFQEQESKRYFLITPLATEGNLSDCLRVKKFEQNDVFTMALRLAQILKYLHYDALKNFRSKKGLQNQRMAIIHRDVKPQNIVFLSKEEKLLYLLDFGIAKIGFTSITESYNNCGTPYYRAPEIGQGRPYNSNVDVYSYGCTLYQILNDGQRLMTSAGIGSRFGQRDRFIRSRLIDLQLKLEKVKKMKNPNYWMKLLADCLTYDAKKRISSEQLLNFLMANPLGTQIARPNFLQISQKQVVARGRKQILQINFQTFRLSIIQDTILSIFQYIYFDQPRINRFTLYTILKFSSLYFNDRLHKLRQRAKALTDKPQKYHHIKNTFDSKVLDLKDKAHGKIEKQIEKEKTVNIMQEKKTIGPIQQMVRKYPQLIQKQCSQPKRNLLEFIYQKKSDLLQNQKFAKYVLTIIAYMQDYDYYEQMRVQNADLQNYDVEVLSVKRLHELKKKLDERLSKDLKGKLDDCKVEGTIKSHVNREQLKTDIEIQRNR